jgi:hypothetical protein
LLLEPARRKDFDLPGHDFPKADLEVIGTGLTLALCAEEGKPSLEVNLQPFTSVDVHVVVNTASPKKPGVAGFHLVDRRKGKDVGGVLLVCMDPPFVEPVSQMVSTPNPCPVTLAMDLYAILPGDDPSNPSNAKPIRLGSTLELVAQITNPTGELLKDTQVYLEHLGASNMEFAPGTWNVGVLGKGDVFYATWLIRATTWLIGSFETGIVVVSEDMDPVRLKGKVSISPRKEGIGSRSSRLRRDD